MSLQVNQTHILNTVVTEDMSAERFGNPGIAVLATPMLVGLVERCCIELLAPELDEGQGSVGIYVEIEHLAPTPFGSPVTVTARVTAIEGRGVTFDVTARDAREEICRVTHKRALIGVQKFLERIAIKAATVAA